MLVWLTLVGILLIEWALSKLRPLYPKNEQVKKALDRYPEFKRNDIHKIGRLFFYLQSPLILIRFAMGWFMVMACCFFIQFLNLFHTQGERYSGIKLELVKICCYIVSRTILATQGFYLGPKL